jgi:hypothetical protein
MIDRKWGRIFPHSESGEWWRSPEGVWLPTMRGGAGFSAYGIPRATLLSHDVSAFTVFATNTIADVLTVGTSGTGLAARFACFRNETVTDFYVFTSSALTGAPTLKWEIRTSNGNAPDTTGPGLVASGTFTPAGSTWNKVTGLSVALSVGTVYWLIIGGNVADGSNKVDLMRQSLNENSGTSIYAPYAAGFTSNGWSGASSVFNAFSSICMAFASGRVIGDPFTSETGVSSTNRRGMFIGSLDPNIGIYGIVGASGAVSGSNGGEIWHDTSGPSGSPAASSVLQFLTDVGSIGGYLFGGPQKIPQGSTARVVFAYSGAGTAPTKMNIGTGTDANLRAMMFGDGAWYAAQANGTTDWSGDDINAFPRMNPLIEDVSAGPGTPIAFSVSDGLPAGAAH